MGNSVHKEKTITKKKSNESPPVAAPVSHGPPPPVINQDPLHNENKFHKKISRNQSSRYATAEAEGALQLKVQFIGSSRTSFDSPTQEAPKPACVFTWRDVEHLIEARSATRIMIIYEQELVIDYDMLQDGTLFNVDLCEIQDDGSKKQLASTSFDLCQLPVNGSAHTIWSKLRGLESELGITITPIGDLRQLPQYLKALPLKKLSTRQVVPNKLTLDILAGRLIPKYSGKYVKGSILVLWRGEEFKSSTVMGFEEPVWNETIDLPYDAETDETTITLKLVNDVDVDVNGYAKTVGSIQPALNLLPPQGKPSERWYRMQGTGAKGELKIRLRVWQKFKSESRKDAPMSTFTPLFTEQAHIDVYVYR